jgi:CheY-like chemotaxis protein
MVNCKSVLIIEDDEAIRTSLDDVLVSEGYTVFGAANGKIALGMLDSLPRPALLLLDLMMPTMNGYDFSDLIRTKTDSSEFPIIVMSASRDGEQFARTKGYTFLKKPLDVDVLLKVVKDFCAPNS